MKKSIITACATILFITPFHAQDVLKYGEIPVKNNKYDQYITKNDNTIYIGTILTLGLPSTDQGFRFITQGGQKCADFLAGKSVEITKIRTYKNQFRGKAYLEFKGYGLIPILIDYELALKSGEIEAASID